MYEQNYPNLYYKTSFASLLSDLECLFSFFLLQRFQTEEHLLIHRHKHEMTLKFSSVKTDAAFTGKSCRPASCEEAAKRVVSFQDRCLIKNITSKPKMQSQGKLWVCVCVCFFDYAMSVFAACQHLMHKCDIFS